MKKYIPSPKNNLIIKEQIVKELNNFIYRLEKGKYNKTLKKETIQDAIINLKNEVKLLDNAIGTGEENLIESIKAIKENFDIVKKNSMNTFNNRFQASLEELIISIQTLRDIINGVISGDISELEQNKTNIRIKRLNEKIGEIADIKYKFKNNEFRIEKDIILLEKDLKELENKMLENDNNRIINDIYRQIKGIKNKINSLNLRRTSYASCSNLLSIIEANAKEIIIAGNFSKSELTLAKTLLNMKKINEVITNPEAVIPILKMMEKDMKEINEKIKTTDQKINLGITDETEINQDALKYKDALLNKNKEKEILNNAKKDLDNFVNKDINEDIEVRGK